jgi:hypothetical protein
MERNVLHIWIVANLLKRQYRTGDKGCPAAWSFREVLTTGNGNSLLRYGTFHKLRNRTDHLKRGEEWEFVEWL